MTQPGTDAPAPTVSSGRLPATGGVPVLALGGLLLLSAVVVSARRRSL